jgi:hypothetical protein
MTFERKNVVMEWWCLGKEVEGYVLARVISTLAQHLRLFIVKLSIIMSGG